jgi:5-methyltetrahydrofolate--homocysteine methyltransferase
MTRTERIAALKAAAKERILILDGSWGVMIQRRGLSEAEFRGERFADHPVQLKGDNDLLCLTRPDIITELHDAY